MHIICQFSKVSKIEEQIVLEKQETVNYCRCENLCQIRFSLLTYIQVTFNESDELILLN